MYVCAALRIRPGPGLTYHCIGIDPELRTSVDSAARHKLAAGWRQCQGTLVKVYAISRLTTAKDFYRCESAREHDISEWFRAQVVHGEQ
jgi:hypothetical protein